MLYYFPSIFFSYRLQTEFCWWQLHTKKSIMWCKTVHNVLCSVHYHVYTGLHYHHQHQWHSDHTEIIDIEEEIRNSSRLQQYWRRWGDPYWWSCTDNDFVLSSCRISAGTYFIYIINSFSGNLTVPYCFYIVTNVTGLWIVSSSTLIPWKSQKSISF